VSSPRRQELDEDSLAGDGAVEGVRSKLHGARPDEEASSQKYTESIHIKV